MRVSEWLQSHPTRSTFEDQFPIHETHSVFHPMVVPNDFMPFRLLSQRQSLHFLPAMIVLRVRDERNL